MRVPVFARHGTSVVVLSILCWTDFSSSSSSSLAFTVSAPFVPRSLALFYQHGHEHESDPENNTRGATNSPPSIVTIPVLAAIPQKPPLMMGADLVLDPPTPLQWYTLEEAILQHARQQQEQQQQQAAEQTEQQQPSAPADASTDARITAAPLVAVLDEYTTTTSTGPKQQQQQRYATIAAVVGMSSSSGSLSSIDTSDPLSFRESLRQIGDASNSQRLPTQSQIRLVGVGRAALSDFFYRVPTRLAEDAQDDQGYFRPELTSSLRSSYGYTNEETGEEQVYDDDDDEDDDEMLRTNIVLARLELWQDGPQRRLGVQQHQHQHQFASPVHALNEMSLWANRLEFLHQDRRRLVAGLQAAKARLQLVGIYNDLQDYDGLGSITAQHKEEEPVSSSSSSSVIPQNVVQQQQQQQQHLMETNARPLHDKENYGLGYSSSSFAGIKSLTQVWLEKLEPYYSPEKRGTEEYYFEILSFVAILCMKDFLTPHDLGWSLQCTNTAERLERTYDWMTQHVRLLADECDAVGQELRECGEECTDLW